MEYAKIMAKFFARMSKYIAPVLFGYEVNEMITDDGEMRMQAYVPIMHEVIKSEQSDGYLKDFIIISLIAFFIVIADVKVYLKYKKSASVQPESMELN